MKPILERIAGGWLVSDIVRGYLVQRKYFGYTKRESLAMFRAEMKGQP